MKHTHQWYQWVGHKRLLMLSGYLGVYGLLGVQKPAYKVIFRSVLNYRTQVVRQVKDMLHTNQSHACAYHNRVRMPSPNVGVIYLVMHC